MENGRKNPNTNEEEQVGPKSLQAEAAAPVSNVKLATASVPRNEHIRLFFKKYFCDGQILDDDAVEKLQDANAPFYVRHRNLLAVVLPALVTHMLWWTFAFRKDLFDLFTEPSGDFDKPRYYMSITMIFGSMVAGATSEGGGAVAFPVMTLALGVDPTVARDFSFLIQSNGMTASSFTITAMRVKVEWRSVIYASLGGIVGIILGLEQIAPHLPPQYSKMYFIVIWSSFAIGLFLLNRNLNRTVYDKIPNWEDGVVWRFPSSMGKYLHINWKREVIFVFGILGGIFSSIAGSGIDICSFAVLTLLFRVSEKVATPTSVVLMAINSVTGVVYRSLVMGGLEDDAIAFWLVCIPIVVIGAPMGALVGSHLHRLTLATIVYIIDAIQLIGALYVVRPWTNDKTDTPLILSLSSLVIFLVGMLFFGFLSRLGLRVMEDIQYRQKKSSFIEKFEVMEEKHGRNSYIQLGSCSHYNSNRPLETSTGSTHRSEENEQEDSSAVSV